MKTIEVGASPVAYEHLSTVTIGCMGDPDAALMPALMSLSAGEHESFAGVQA
jgi:hypothetical protein